jgi:hypothetical protein
MKFLPGILLLFLFFPVRKRPEKDILPEKENAEVM